MVLDELLRQGDDILRLVAPEADGADMTSDAGFAQRRHFRGGRRRPNSSRVALLTPVSVACADSATATSRVNGLSKASSVFGSGLSSARRR